MWFKGDQVVDDYIVNHLESTWDPKKTLRMSIINGKQWGNVQLVIPPGLLNSKGGGMGLAASCKKKLGDLPGAVVNYGDWQINTKGSKTDPFT
ncbi:hypothetical protein CPB83DRAFT_841469 [Crepidotus variabilis]|uniref:Uncharacterized protein n=1 Tax=Crepidotus variabilis TaxID=179855 RepID=A0A9P6EV37_9AGAR|nr:hypothetical protein CPB83DRAFT_841469 [Crepidotus variabilis]